MEPSPISIGGAPYSAWAGWIYRLVDPSIAINGEVMGKKIKRAAENC
ncbi:MAG: hypothetical protein HYZ10_16015 [Ignavibacteriales bacterium]|nr:hypothetical protein [Ignavibacteriales bacterium]